MLTAIIYNELRNSKNRVTERMEKAGVGGEIRLSYTETVLLERALEQAMQVLEPHRVGPIPIELVG